MDIQKQGRQLALAFMNLDDLVLAKEVSGSGRNLFSLASRSLVGSAVVGAGIATRAAVFGAQVATKSALAIAGVAKGRVPGGDVVEQIAYDIDQSVGRQGEAASSIAARGVGIAKPDRQPPTEPIFGDPWLGKRITPGSTPGTVLVGSAIDLTRIAAMPLTMGTTALAGALATPAGQQVTRSFWDAVSAVVDAVAPRSTDRISTKTDRSERRAMLMLSAVAPLVAAAQDLVELGTTLSRNPSLDGEVLQAAFNRALERIDESRRSLTSAVSGAIDVDGIEAWVRADEANRAGGGCGLPEKSPDSVKQLETMVAAFPADAFRHTPGLAGAIELARDTIFLYSTRALGRDAALVRMERLFGPDVRNRLADDCSLRPEFADAKADRNARLAALVAQLQAQGPNRLHQARERAAERLASLTVNSADRLVERLLPQRIAERVAVLQRFIGLADVANGLAAVPSSEPARRHVVTKFNDWMRVSAPVH